MRVISMSDVADGPGDRRHDGGRQRDHARDRLGDRFDDLIHEDDHQVVVGHERQHAPAFAGAVREDDRAGHRNRRRAPGEHPFGRVEVRRGTRPGPRRTQGGAAARRDRCRPARRHGSCPAPRASRRASPAGRGANTPARCRRSARCETVNSSTSPARVSWLSRRYRRSMAPYSSAAFRRSRPDASRIRSMMTSRALFIGPSTIPGTTAPAGPEGRGSSSTRSAVRADS